MEMAAHNCLATAEIRSLQACMMQASLVSRDGGNTARLVICELEPENGYGRRCRLRDLEHLDERAGKASSGYGPACSYLQWNIG